MNLRSLITACLVVLAAALPAVLADIDAAPLWLAQGRSAAGEPASQGQVAQRPSATAVPQATRF